MLIDYVIIKLSESKTTIRCVYILHNHRWGRGSPTEFDGGERGLKSKHGGAWGSLKYCRKIHVAEFI